MLLELLPCDHHSVFQKFVRNSCLILPNYEVILMYGMIMERLEKKQGIINRAELK